MKKVVSLLLTVFLLSNLAVYAQETSGIGNGNGKNVTIANNSGKKVSVEEIEKDMAEALTLIQENYVNGKRLNYNDLFKSSIEGMLSQLDPHSNYFDVKEFEQFANDQSSKYFGIGATIGDLRQGNEISTYIKSTFPDSPAYRAGLRYGDKILEVNGVSMSGKIFSEVRTFLRGPRGTVAKVVVERYGTKKKETFDIVRDAVAQPSIPEVYMIRPGVGYVAMTGGFNQTTGAEFREGLKALKAQGLQNLIIDLRNNGGGLVREAYAVANTFLGAGQVVFTQKGRMNNTSDPVEARNPNPDQTPIVMLVNRNTASASEILAGALQDHDRALIVGENTFGKALVMNPFSLDYGSMLMLVIAKYETPSGRLIQRDYSDGSNYNYRNQSNNGEINKPKQNGAESRTDSGRIVYGGNGIAPDIFVKPQTIPLEKAQAQQKLLDSLQAFSFELAFGKFPEFANYKVDKEIQFGYDIKPDEFIVNEPLFEAYKQFAVQKFKANPALIDREKEFVQRTIRTELVTAAYGSQTAFQVFNEYDEQLLKGIEALPKAKELAQAGAKAQAEKNKQANKNK